MRALVQPQVPPWVIARASDATATDTLRMPMMSGAGPPTFDSASDRRATTAAINAMGRFTKKAQRQPPLSIRRDPSDGPVATARAAIPPQRETAAARASGG